MTTAVGHNWVKGTKSLVVTLALAFAQVASGVTHQMDCCTGEAIQFDARLSVGDRLALALPGNERFCLELVEASLSKLGGEAFLGRVEGSDGLLAATVVRGKKGLKITFTSPTDGRIYVIRSTARGMRVRTVNPADSLRQPSPSLFPERRPAGRGSRAFRRAQNRGPVTVDVMVAYERGAQEWLDGEDQDAETFALSAVSRMNAVLANTGLSSSFRFRLVGTLPVNARSGSIDAVLNAVTKGTGAWGAVSTYRDEVGADIVTTLIDTGSESGTTGLGWSLTDEDGTGDYSWFADSAFNVCSIRSVEISHTMTHEVGHNMGAGHSDLQLTQAGPQLFNYSSGYYFTANGKPYHTIMAYYTDGRTNTFYEEVPFFSSPLYTYEGVAVGNGTHDNTQTLKRTFEQVAEFRAAKTDPGEESEPEPEPEPLTWYTTRAEAFAAAVASGRRILLVWGRDTCGNTMATRNYTCEDPAVKERLLAGYVLWYSDCDTQASESSGYLVNFEGILPGVSVIDPLADKALTGAGGYQDVPAMLALLAEAEVVKRPKPEDHDLDDDGESGERVPYETSAAVYDGMLVDEKGAVKGTIQVKVAKMKNGAAKVTATVQLADGSRKISFKNGVADEYGNVTGLTAAGHALSVSLGASGMAGTMDGNSVDGARNVFSAKDAASKAAAAAIEKKWIGAVNVVGDGVVLSVTVAKKGKVKVAGTVDGVKVSATSQLLVGAETCCIPVVIAKRANLAFNLWLRADGSVEIAGLDGATAGRAGALKSGAAFRMDGAALARALPGLYGDYLPGGLSVAQSGTKWVVAGDAKAGKLKLLKDSSEIDREKSKFTDNMSGLKLTYKAKDGSFKGSFKAYAVEKGKLKSYTVNVTGVMVGDTGYGEATLKKPAVSFPITVE